MYRNTAAQYRGGQPVSRVRRSSCKTRDRPQRILIHDLSNEEVELPAVDGFELQTVGPCPEPDPETKESLVAQGKVSEEYWEKPYEPATISFERTDDESGGADE